MARKPSRLVEMIRIELEARPPRRNVRKRRKKDVLDPNRSGSRSPTRDIGITEERVMELLKKYRGER
jgi:hypothetical protein